MKSTSKTVIAIDGKEYPADKCVKRKTGYYLLGDRTIKGSGHCYYFEELDKTYRDDTGYIIYDHRLNKYVLKKNIDVVKGIIGVNKDGTFEMGSFSTSISSVRVTTKMGHMYVCLSREIFKNSRIYKECLGDGHFYHVSTLRASQFIIPQPCNKNDKYELKYNADDYINNAVKNFNSLNQDYKCPYPNIETYGDFIQDYSFGLEFETVKGMIPHDICNYLGLIPVRDGSIAGFEYVTIPMLGTNGLSKIIDITKELDKRTEYDINCSLHFHIGGIPRTESYILALFKVLCTIEDSMFKLFPFYKKDNMGVKKKCYTKPFPKQKTMFLLNNSATTKEAVRKDFSVLFNYLSMNYDYDKYGSKLSNVLNHPSDPNGNSKWNIKTRYHWVNLIPIIFGNKKTVEFRLHSATTDADRILNFLAICVGILHYTKVNVKYILKSNKNIPQNINELIVNLGWKNYLRNKLTSYCIDRRKQIEHRFAVNKDIICAENDMQVFWTNFDWTSKVQKSPKFTYYDYEHDDGNYDFVEAVINQGEEKFNPFKIHNLKIDKDQQVQEVVNQVFQENNF